MVGGLMEKVKCLKCGNPIFSAYFQDGAPVVCPYCKEEFIITKKMRKPATDKKNKEE